MTAKPHDKVIVLRKLVRGPWEPEEPPSKTSLSPCDQTSIAIATTRATFLQQQLDGDALERALSQLIEDLPFLGGR